VESGGREVVDDRVAISGSVEDIIDSRILDSSEECNPAPKS